MQATANQLSKAIGRQGYLHSEGLAVRVTIHDTRQVWGRVDLLVSPVCGDGSKWVSWDRVVLVDGIATTNIR